MDNEYIKTEPIDILATELSSEKYKVRKLTNNLIVEKFGAYSEFYKWTTESIGLLWDTVRNKKKPATIFSRWRKIFSNIYGFEPSLDLFVNHVYLTLLAKTILYLWVNNRRCAKANFEGVLSNKYFKSKCIGGIFDQDFSIWLSEKSIMEDSKTFLARFANILSEFDLEQVEEDIFQGIYEELIGRADRHKAGEYYTPEWLVMLTLNSAFRVWHTKDRPPQILDPACGSGTFIYHSIRMLIDKFQLTPEQVIQYVKGIDINPIAVLISKVNYVLAVGSFFKDNKELKIPIYNADALQDIGLFNLGSFEEKVDIIVGNPPWIVLRSIKSKKYQDFVKKEAMKYKLISNGDTHLYTQMDIATLFFRKCADRYLEEGGVISFVMPRSVIAGTLQHVSFRKFDIPPVKLAKIIDLEDVTPLFNVPTCVLVGIKGIKTSYPVTLERYSGELPSRNLKYPEVTSRLLAIEQKYTPMVNVNNELSYYYDKFNVGVSIFPRSLYFVNLEKVEEPVVKVNTSKAIIKVVKDPWKKVLEGKVETDFIYSTILSWEMIPFGYVKMRPIALPVVISQEGFVLYDVPELKRLGYGGIATWLENAQRVWSKNRTPRSKELFPRLINRLNYNHLLSAQNPIKKYIVLYNATGKNITSCVIDKHNLPEFSVHNSLVTPKGFIIDIKTWFFETDSKGEAYYLCAILNSYILSKAIKPYQPRGLFGARAIHRRPLMFPIPKFSKENDLHIELSQMGKQCYIKVRGLKEKRTKNFVKQILSDEIQGIDELVSELLNVKHKSVKEG